MGLIDTDANEYRQIQAIRAIDQGKRGDKWVASTHRGGTWSFCVPVESAFVTANEGGIGFYIALDSDELFYRSDGPLRGNATLAHIARERDWDSWFYANPVEVYDSPPKP